MALLPILEFPDPRLRTRAEPVRVFDAGLKQLGANMLETLYAAPGIGLAATQVDVQRALLVIDPSDTQDQRQAYIKPEILAQDGLAMSEEGCLSVPNIYEPVQRAARVRVRAQDVEGQVFERELEGVEAVCVQHEMDHLTGKLFVDYLSSLKRYRIRRKLEKERRERPASPSAAAAGAGRAAGTAARVI